MFPQVRQILPHFFKTLVVNNEDRHSSLHHHSKGLLDCQPPGVGNLAEGEEGCRDAEWVREVATIDIAKEDKGLVIGKSGKNIKRIRLLLNRHHNITDVLIM